MTTIISGTNREGNLSVKVANNIQGLLKTLNAPSQLLDLQDLPADFLFNNDAFGTPSRAFSEMATKYIYMAERFVFVVPEYNGSIPGLTKAFIDAVLPKHFSGKKAALVGLSSGRAGNLRGLDHLTGILNYLNVHVLPMKCNLSHIDDLLDSEGIIHDKKTLQILQEQMERLSKW